MNVGAKFKKKIKIIKIKNIYNPYEAPIRCQTPVDVRH